MSKYYSSTIRIISIITLIAFISTQTTLGYEGRPAFTQSQKSHLRLKQLSETDSAGSQPLQQKGTVSGVYAPPQAASTIGIYKRWLQVFSQFIQGWLGRKILPLGFILTVYLLGEGCGRSFYHTPPEKQQIGIRMEGGNHSNIFALEKQVSSGDMSALKKLIDLVESGNAEAVYVLEDFVLDGNTSAKEALKMLNPSIFIEKLKQGNKEAREILYRLRHHGNVSAREGLKTLIPSELIKKAEQGNEEAVRFLDYLAFYGNTSVGQALKTINPYEFIKKAEQGNRGALDFLGRIACGGNTSAKEALKTLNPDKLVEKANQGNMGAIDTLVYFEFSLASYGNTSAKEALKTLNLDKLVEKAEQGNEGAVDVLRYLASDGNSSAREALKTLNPDKFIEKAEQGSNVAVSALGHLVPYGNTSAKEILKTFNPDKFIAGLAMHIDTPYRRGLITNLIVIGNEKVLDALLASIVPGHENEYYYGIHSYVLEIAFDMGIPKKIRNEALSSYRQSFKRSLSYMKFEPGVNNPEVMKIVDRAIDLTTKSAAVNVARKRIEAEFHRPPQKILFYLSMPEAVYPLLQAHSQLTDGGSQIDLSYFIGAAFAEGYIKYAQALVNGIKKLPLFSADSPLGVDRFGSVQRELRNKGWLPKDYDGFEPDRDGITFKNEAGEKYPQGTFKNATAALVAHGSLLLQDEDRFLTASKRRGYEINHLSKDVIRVGTYLFYCTRNPERYLTRYGLNGLIGKGRIHGDGLFNAQWPAATARFLEEMFTQTAIARAGAAADSEALASGVATGGANMAGINNAGIAGRLAAERTQRNLFRMVAMVDVFEQLRANQMAAITALLAAKKQNLNRYAIVINAENGVVAGLHKLGFKIIPAGGIAEAEEVKKNLPAYSFIVVINENTLEILSDRPSMNFPPVILDANFVNLLQSV